MLGNVGVADRSQIAVLESRLEAVESRINRLESQIAGEVSEVSESEIADG
jgi:hypothetical protein